MVQVEENQTEIIGRVGHPKGSGQFTVEVPSNIVDQASDDSTTTEVLVQLGRSMNNSRKTKTWVKRGSYCYLEMFEDAKTKVCGEMTSILSSSDEKTLRKTDKWYVRLVRALASLIRITGQKHSQ